MNTLRFSSYNPKKLHLEKYDHMIPFLTATLAPRDHHASVFVFKNEVLHLRNMVGKTAIMKQMFKSGMLHRMDVVKKNRIHGEMIFY